MPALANVSASGQPANATYGGALAAGSGSESHPGDAGETFATCFVDVEGREDRLPLAFRGQAVGPLAVFNYDALEVGDVFVGAVHQYEVELVNRGEIECAFARRETESDADSGRVFSFEPNAGAIGVGQSRTITVTLCSETLGAFDETFEFAVEGRAVADTPPPPCSRETCSWNMPKSRALPSKIQPTSMVTFSSHVNVPLISIRFGSIILTP